MSGTRKLEKFEPGEAAPAFQSGTQKLEKYTPAPALIINTPVAEVSAAMLAAARSSIIPEEPPHEPPPEPAPDVPQPDREQPRSARSADREPGVEKLRTRLARKFTTLADRVTDGFDDFRIGAGWWAVELTAPDGMSTGGGKQVLQHLRLRPTRQGFSVLVGGVVNAVEKTAELRDHAHMDATYRARFGRALEITPAEWEQFLRKAELVLQHESIRTTRSAAPHDVQQQLARAGGSAPAGAARKRAAGVALIVVAAAAALVVWRVIVALWP